MADQFFQDGDDATIIDMNEVVAATNELIPAGTYDAVIEAVECKPSANSGQPTWYLTFVLVGSEYDGRKLFGNMSFSPKALPMTKATIESVMPELLENPSAFNPSRIANEDVLTGKAVRLQTTVEKYQGDDKTRVKKILPAALSGGDDYFAEATDAHDSH